MRDHNGFFAIKVDLMKAYDRMHWSFIHKVLCEVGLPSVMVNFAMHCVRCMRLMFFGMVVRLIIFVLKRGEGRVILSHFICSCYV